MAYMYLPVHNHEHTNKTSSILPKIRTVVSHCISYLNKDVFNTCDLGIKRHLHMGIVLSWEKVNHK